MLIFDGDYPMAFGALDINRDLTLPLEQARALPDEEANSAWPNREIMATLPEMRRDKKKALTLRAAIQYNFKETRSTPDAGLQRGMPVQTLQRRHYTDTYTALAESANLTPLPFVLPSSIICAMREDVEIFSCFSLST